MLKVCARIDYMLVAFFTCSRAFHCSQNLAYLGAASTPVVCGFILAGFNPLYFLLYLLGLLLVGDTIFYVEGAGWP